MHIVAMICVRVRVRNRRWGAARAAGQHFTEEAMRQRNPLLYDQLVGQHLSEQQRQEQQKPAPDLR